MDAARVQGITSAFEDVIIRGYMQLSVQPKRLVICLLLFVFLITSGIATFVLLNTKDRDSQSQERSFSGITSPQELEEAQRIFPRDHLKCSGASETIPIVLNPQLSNKLDIPKVVNLKFYCPSEWAASIPRKQDGSATPYLLTPLGQRIDFDSGVWIGTQSVTDYVSAHPPALPGLTVTVRHASTGVRPVSIIEIDDGQSTEKKKKIAVVSNNVLITVNPPPSVMGQEWEKMVESFAVSY